MHLLLLLLACSVTPPAAPTSPWRVAGAEVREGPFHNRLATASSPYLRHHGDNPVDWYPWGDEAFAEAERRGVPIFLSIGYAACHWCHVMEDESFADPVLAAYLNEHFVAVKVDREERPDVDAVYIDAVTAVTGSAGWPASVWLMPSGEPFYAGTYFPPESRGGRPAFRDVLEQVHRVWEDDRAAVQDDATRLTAALRAAVLAPAAQGPDDPLDEATSALVRAWDAETAGWGARKFPMTPRLSVLLAAATQGDAAAGEVVRQTLWAMDRGGIHDQLGGAFHRYTVDPRWQIPHFEQMLTDNGQLLGLYAAAAVALDEPRFAEVAAGIATALRRDFLLPSGAFASSRDADAAGVEGSTYLWTPAEVRAVLGDEAAPVLTAYTITEAGNHEGRTVLTRPTAEPVDPALVRRLLAERATRAQPALDDKVVLAFNALAVHGLAVSGRLLLREDDVRLAAQVAETLLAARSAEGRLPRTLASDSPPGVLADYAELCLALVALYEATGELRWLRGAESLAAQMDADFWQEERGLWQDSADPDLLVAQSTLADGPEPGAVSRALLAQQQLLALGSPAVQAARIERARQVAGAQLAASPGSAPTLAWSTHLAANPARTFVIAVGTGQSPDALAAVWSARWRPDGLLAVVRPEDRATAQSFAALVDKSPGESGPRAYLCFDGVCRQPVSTAADARALLDEAP